MKHLLFVVVAYPFLVVAYPLPDFLVIVHSIGHHYFLNGSTHSTENSCKEPAPKSITWTQVFSTLEP